MPGGPTPLGFAYFVGVKFVGYTVAAHWLRHSYPETKTGAAVIGAARTGIGVGAGLLYGGLWIYALSKIDYEDWVFVAYFAGLLPIRIAEWTWLLHLFFDKNITNKRKAILCVIGGIVWSFCLDWVGVFAAFVVPGGAWVC